MQTRPWLLHSWEGQFTPSLLPKGPQLFREIISWEQYWFFFFQLRKNKTKQNRKRKQISDTRGRALVRAEDQELFTFTMLPSASQVDTKGEMRGPVHHEAP